MTVPASCSCCCSACWSSALSSGIHSVGPCVCMPASPSVDAPFSPFEGVVDGPGGELGDALLALGFGQALEELERVRSCSLR